MKEISLYRNAKKSVKLLLMSAGICILLLGIFLHSIGLFDGILRTKSAVFAGGVLLITLFFLFRALLELRDKSARIVLNSEYFIGKTTPLSRSFGAGEWADVVDIGLHQVGGDRLVVVTLTNSSKYKGRLSSTLWKMAYDNQRDVLTIMHSSSDVELNPNELFDLFTSYWQESKSKSNAIS